jgi:hypothetical protein
MDHVDETGLGLPKVVVVGRALRKARRLDRPAICTIPRSVTVPAGMAAARRCDVLFSCPDNDAARLATALIATRYQRILIDVGVGVLRTERAAEGRDAGEGPGRRVGADVRLIVPADGCLLCRGGLTDLSGAIRTSAGTALPVVPGESRRMGTLASLNQIATGLAVTVLQDFVAERVDRSMWAHLEFDAGGKLAVTYPETTAPARCELCEQSGLGDALETA